jgi:hypothetical protein
MAAIAKVRSGELRTVYDDRWAGILSAIGKVTIERASDVEYDHGAGEWVATHHATGVVIARGANRSEVIAAEVRWLEERI